MKRINLDIIMTDMHGENIHNQITGFWEDKGSTTHISYNDDTGLNELLVKEDSVVLLRKGAEVTRMVFDCFSRRKMFYKTGGLNTVLWIETHRMAIEKNSVTLDYTLYSDDIVVNTLKFCIKKSKEKA